jgi:hypothetical protein
MLLIGPPPVFLAYLGYAEANSRSSEKKARGGGRRGRPTLLQRSGRRVAAA